MSEWPTIDTAPRDGTPVVLYHADWDVAHIARWDVVEGPDENGEGGFSLWHLMDETGGAMGDGFLWPDEDHMPTHWIRRPGSAK